MLTVVYCILIYMSIAGCEMLHNTHRVHFGIYSHSHYMVHVYNSGNGGILSAGVSLYVASEVLNSLQFRVRNSKGVQTD